MAKLVPLSFSATRSSCSGARITEIEAYAATLATPVEYALLGAGRPDLTAATEAVLRRLGRDVPAWPVTGSAAANAGVIRGIFVGSAAMARRLNAAVDVNGIVPLIGARFGFAQAKAAYAHAWGPDSFAKTVIEQAQSR